MGNMRVWHPAGIPEELQAFAKRCEHCEKARAQASQLVRHLASPGHCGAKLRWRGSILECDDLEIHCSECHNSGWKFQPALLALLYRARGVIDGAGAGKPPDAWSPPPGQEVIDVVDADDDGRPLGRKD
jgi:hypothetical protein